MGPIQPRTYWLCITLPTNKYATIGCIQPPKPRNLGQLMTQRCGDRKLLFSFFTHPVDEQRYVDMGLDTGADGSSWRRST